MSTSNAHIAGRLAGIDFLLHNQQATGAWVDFELAPGPSDTWVTAFVALVLTRIRSLLNERREAAAVAVERAVDFLLRHARPGGEALLVWGYNDQVPPDADSTAHVALLLQAHSHPAARAATLALRSFQREDGGFATFRRRNPADSWGHSHADVSAVALRALSGGLPPGDPVLVNGVSYLRQVRQTDGMWPSFWWATPLFATAASLRCYRHLGVLEIGAALGATLEKLDPSRVPFDQALCLAILRLVRGNDSRAASLAQELWRAQLPDGSWPSTARLRVPDPSSITGEQAGTVCADQNRLYTTATVLHALARS